MRFAVARAFIPMAAFAAQREEVEQWWDGWVALWGTMFSSEARRRWRGEQRGELDAVQLDSSSHGGYAAGCGSDEG